MTQYQLIDGLRVVFKFLMRLFALFGLFCLIALGSYEYHKDVKVVRSDRCINSLCDPDQKCPVKFKRHVGECNGTR